MFCLEVWGDGALFTRPEMKVERVSYPVITPSACRAIFEAILWKPAIAWQIHKIEVLKPIEWLSIRRNEVGKKMSKMPFYIDDNRQQRASLLLKNVAYRIYADFTMTEKAGKEDNYKKFAEMFVRRAKKGQCVYQPYLGCREFSAFFEFVELDDNQHPILNKSQFTPISQNQDFGFMLYDIDFSDINNPEPMFFHAKMLEGQITIPSVESDEVKR